jgi:nucleoside-diphosphate-sugar epimerase
VQRILVTGAAGRIGSRLCPWLARPGRVLRLLDLDPIPPAPGVEPVVADLTDPTAMAAACAGVDAVVHLGAIPTEAPWADLLHVNIDGTRTVLEAARGAGVPRIVLASTMHVAGFWHRDAAPADGGGLPAGVPARPDTYYGVSKAAVEALGSLYADRFGMAVFALRLGACFPEPLDESLLESWLSPADCARLVEACLSTDAGGFRILWGVSRNTRRWWSLAEAAEIGYAPRDDSDRFAGPDLPAAPESDAPDLLGRHFCRLPLGQWSDGRRRPAQD